MTKYLKLIAAVLMTGGAAFGEIQQVNGYTWTYYTDEWHWSEESGNWTTVSVVQSISPQPGENFTIPAKLGEYPIDLNDLSYSWNFSDNFFAGVKDLEFAEGVTEIPSGCFTQYQGWRALRSVKIPRSVTRIGSSCFSDTPMMKAKSLDEMNAPVISADGQWLLGLKSYEPSPFEYEDYYQKYRQNIVLDSSIAKFAADGALNSAFSYVPGAKVIITGSCPENWACAFSSYYNDRVVYYQSGADGWSQGEVWGGVKTYPLVELAPEYAKSSLKLGKLHTILSGQITSVFPAKKHNFSEMEERNTVALPTMDFDLMYKNINMQHFVAVPVYGAASADEINPIVDFGDSPKSLFGAAQVVTDREMMKKIMPDISTKPNWDIHGDGESWEYESSAKNYEWPIGLWENSKPDPTRHWILVDCDFLARVKTGTWSARTSFRIGLTGVGVWSETGYVAEAFAEDDLYSIPLKPDDVIRGVTFSGYQTPWTEVNASGECNLVSKTIPYKITLNVPSAGILRLEGNLYDDDGISKEMLRISGRNIVRDEIVSDVYYYAAVREIELSAATQLTLSGARDFELELDGCLFYPSGKRSIRIGGQTDGFFYSDYDDYTFGCVKGMGVYSVGERVTLEVIAREGEVFDHWESPYGLTLPSDVDIKNPKLSFVLTDEMVDAYESATGGTLPEYGAQILARCKPRQTIIGLPTKAGTAVVKGAGMYLPGQEALLKVEPAEGCTFVRWLDGETTNPRRVVADESGVEAVYYAVVDGEPPIPRVEVQADDQSVNWTGAAQSPRLKIVKPVTGGTLMYRADPTAAWTTTVPSFKNPGEYTVYYKASAPKTTGLAETIGSLVFTILPAPTVIIDIDGAGSATGTGFYKMGSTVNLKATAMSGYVFAGWYEGGEPMARGTADYRQPTYSIKIEEIEIHLTARFVPKSSDFFVFAMLDADYSGYTAGAMIDAIPLYVDSQSLPTVTAAGLPAGLKFDPKTLCVSGIPSAPGEYRAKFSIKNAAGANYVYEEMIKIRNYECSLDLDYEEGYTFRTGVGLSEDPVFGSVMAGEYIGWTVSGLPAGIKFDAKTGLFTGAATASNKSYTVTFTKKEGSVVVEKGTVTMRTEALPSAAAGTFRGTAFRYLSREGREAVFGAFTLTASATGALKATVAAARQTYTFSATSWTGDDADGVFNATMRDKAGNCLALVLDSEATWAEDHVTGYLLLADGNQYEIAAQANAFAVKRYFVAESANEYGHEMWALEEVDEPSPTALTVSLKADGTASIVGKIGIFSVNTTAPIGLHEMEEGAFNMTFASIVTSSGVKKILSITLSLDLTGFKTACGRVVLED